MAHFSHSDTVAKVVQRTIGLQQLCEIHLMCVIMQQLHPILQSVQLKFSPTTASIPLPVDGLLLETLH